MTVYKSNNKNSVFASVDFDDTEKTAFLFVKNEADVDKAKALVAQAGEQVLAQSYVSGRTVIIASLSEGKNRLFGQLQAATGEQFVPDKPATPTTLQFLRKHGWKIRGGSSVVGQSMTLFSAFNAVSTADAAAGNLKPKFDPAIGAFAVLNLAANFVNYVFGGQKEEDIKGLEKFDDIIADEVNRYLPSGTQPVSADDVRKLSYMNEKELEEHNKDRSAAGILRKNSVRLGEVGLRTLGSLFMMFNYKKVIPAVSQLAKGEFKEAFFTAKVQDKGTFLAGCGMVAGKIMGLLAKTYDPNDPPKTYLEELRQKVFWTTSSFTEMIAQSSVAYDRSKNKRLVLGGKVHSDFTGVAGNVLLTVPPYPTRLVLPYGKKVLDTDEVQARLLDELPKLPQDKIPEVAARVTARMVEHMGEGVPRFSELYSDMMRKLRHFHQIDALSTQVEAPVEQATSFAEKLGAPKANIIKDIVNKDNSTPSMGSALQM